MRRTVPCPRCGAAAQPIRLYRGRLIYECPHCRSLVHGPPIGRSAGAEPPVLPPVIQVETPPPEVDDGSE